MAELAIVGASISMLTALIQLARELKTALKQKSNHVTDNTRFELLKMKIEKQVNKANEVLHKEKGFDLETLTNLVYTVDTLKIHQDDINYKVKHGFEGGNDGEELLSRLDSTIEKLSGQLERMKNAQHPENQSSDHEKEAEMPPGSVRRFLLYLSLFPKDFVFNRKRISRLSVAKEFTPEGSGERLLRQLSEWIEVVDGDGAHFRIGNSVGDQSPKWPEKDIFSFRNAFAQSTESIPNKKILSSLIFRGLSNHTLDLKERDFLYIRILCLRSVNLKNQEHLKKLSFLQYLDLKHTANVGGCDWLESLEELQVLDLRYTSVDEIPNRCCLEKLEKLQHLLLGYIPKRSEAGGVNRLAGVKLNIEKLKTENLKTLRAIRLPLVKEIKGNISKVVDLSVTGLKTNNLKDFWNAVANFEKLTSLGVAVTADSAITLQDCPKRLKDRLERLRMEGQSHSGLDKLREFKKLVDLTLVSPKEIDSLPSLSSLICLRLYDVREKKSQKTLTFQEKVFMKLKKLVIGDMKMLETVEIGKVVFQTVGTLKLCNLPKFKELVCLEPKCHLLRRKLDTAVKLKKVGPGKNIFLRCIEFSGDFQKSPDLKIYNYDKVKQCYKEVKETRKQ